MAFPSAASWTSSFLLGTMQVWGQRPRDSRPSLREAPSSCISCIRSSWPRLQVCDFSIQSRRALPPVWWRKGLSVDRAQCSEGLRGGPSHLQRPHSCSNTIKPISQAEIQVAFTVLTPWWYIKGCG